MRNLKRVLSLALAMVMVLGLMVIGTSASTFTDDEKITYTEAMDVMQGLGVFEGKPDGSVGPQDVLTRSEAAVLLARIMLGKKGADTLIATKQLFNDVPANEWYAPEVEYCYNAGLIAGYNGNFDPNGKLTGVSFAKLLLVAMGYDAAAQGYLGDDWSTSIAVDALKADLVINGVSLANQLTREQAGQMILQALDEKTVTYTTAYDYATGAPIKIGPNEVKNVRFMDKYFKGLVQDFGGQDMWGNPIEYTWYYKTVKNTLYTKIYEPVAEYFTAVSDCDVVKDLDIKGKYTDYESWVDGEKTVGGDEWYSLGTKDYDTTGTGVWTRIYEVDELDDDFDEAYVCVSINTYFGQVTKVVTEKTDKNGHVIREAGVELDVYVTSDTANKYTVADDNYFITDDEYAKKDYVLVYICDDEVVEIELAEYETETVKRITKETDVQIGREITAKDGDEYAENVKFFLGEEELATKVEYDLYLDTYGNIIAAIEVEDEAAYITGVITRLNWVDTNKDDEDGWARATITTMDAEAHANTELVYNDVNDTALKYADGAKKEDCIPSKGNVASNRQTNTGWHDILYVYEQNKNGSYDIYEQAAEGKFDELSPKAYNEITADGKTYRTNGNTVYLIKTVEAGKDVYTSYTGYKNVPAIIPAEGKTEFDVQYFLDAKGKYIGEVFIDATGLVFTGDSTVVYVVDTDTVYVDMGVEYFEAYVGTDTADFALADGKSVPSKGLYTLLFNADDEVIKFAPAGDAYEVTAIEGDVLMLLTDKDEDIEIDEDEVPFYAYSEYGVKEGTVRDIKEGDEVLVLEKAGKVVAVYYEAVEED